LLDRHEISENSCYQLVVDLADALARVIQAYLPLVFVPLDTNEIRSGFLVVSLVRLGLP
jgi:hypothetical protein